MNQRVIDALLALATNELRPAPGGGEPRQSAYREAASGLVWDKPTVHGSVTVPLTNFNARIVAEIVEDDGSEERRLFEIEATVGRRTTRLRVTATSFGAMNWPTEHQGPGAIVFAGLGIRDHARVAIQQLSGDVPARRVFVHTGWTTVDGQDVYLHGDGAIGGDGVVPDIEVRLDPPLDRYRLPEPPTGAGRGEAIRASLAMLEVGPDRITVVGLASVGVALLGESDVSLHYAGPTGVFKTAFAGLLQAHFGAGMDDRHLPGTWTSTANANEAIAFLAKDAIYVVDDYAPGDTREEVSRLQRDANRLFRGKGNGAGRGRMRADTSLRPPRPARALILSTGEEVPRGASLNARITVVDIDDGDIKVTELTRCQADAADGRYASATAGFVHYLARLGPEGRTRLRHTMTGNDSLAPKGSHRRIPRNLQLLAAGFAAFLDYADDAGALRPGERGDLWERALVALGALGRAQAAQQAEADPARRFVELLGSAVGSGRAHLATVRGTMPANPGAWGWRCQQRAVGSDAVDVWTAQGIKVGWLDGTDLYLEPSAAHAAADAVGAAIGEVLGLRSRTLHKRLNKAGMLVSTEQERGHLTVRRVLEGQRRDVLHLDVRMFEGGDGPATESHEPRPRTTRGPFPGADPATLDPWIVPSGDPPMPPPSFGFSSVGPNGPNGPITATGESAPYGQAWPSHRADLPDGDLIDLVRRQLADGALAGRVIQLTSGARLVDPPLAASNWLAELGHDGWRADVARVHLVRLGRILAQGTSDA